MSIIWIRFWGQLHKVLSLLLLTGRSHDGSGEYNTLSAVMVGTSKKSYTRGMRELIWQPGRSVLPYLMTWALQNNVDVCVIEKDQKEVHRKSHSKLQWVLLPSSCTISTRLELAKTSLSCREGGTTAMLSFI